MRFMQSPAARRGIGRAPEGLLIQIRKSETDHEGMGAAVAVPKGETACPVAALKAWLEAAGITEGAVLRRVFNERNQKLGGRLSGTSWPISSRKARRVSVSIPRHLGPIRPGADWSHRPSSAASTCSRFAIRPGTSRLKCSGSIVGMPSYSMATRQRGCCSSEGEP
jgi:hypothetical protein